MSTWSPDKSTLKLGKGGAVDKNKGVSSTLARGDTTDAGGDAMEDSSAAAEGGRFFIVIFNDMDPMGACGQELIRSGIVIMVEDTPALLVVVRRLNFSPPSSSPTELFPT
mmetsp:Transcript_20227/g.36336  ORF Transcript_20227/g.36336 Transcript_20227/m.36336 type:complete len:110 (-) Transcript_20227:1340-1669(-)